MKKIYFGFNLFLSSFRKRRCFFLFCFLGLMLLNSFKSYGQVTYFWSPISTDFTAAGNWSPAPRTTPLPSDILIFNNTGTVTVTNIPTQTIGQLIVTNGTIVNLEATAGGNTLTISGSITAVPIPGDDLSVAAGCALNIDGTDPTSIFVATAATGNIIGNMTFSNGAQTIDAVDAHGITFTSPSIFTQNCPGSVFTTGGNPNTILFTTGTLFLKLAGNDPMGLALPDSKIVFNAGSLFKIQHDYLPSFAGRTYANIEIASSAFIENVGGAGVFNVDSLIISAGNLTISQTGGTNIKGNISVATGQTLNFTPASANTLSFNGSSAQTVTDLGATSFTFGNNEAVVFNNASGITFAANVSFNNLVTFTSGIVTVPNPKVFTLTTTANIGGTVTNASFVDGKVKKIGNTAFVFPVGKAVTGFTGYVPIEITNPILATASDSYTAEYIRSSAYGLGSITATGLKTITNLEYFTLDRLVTDPASTMDVTLHWTAETSSNGSAGFIGPLSMSALVVAHYGGSSWDTYGLTSTATGNPTAGTVTWSAPAPTAYGPFAIGSISFANPLPINLNYLNGTKQNTNNYLNWQVTCGVNNSTAIMNLERSADGRNFASITGITADAIRCQQPFDYTDKKPLYGMNYYRLKMSDVNGKVTYSSVIAILNKESGFDIIGLMPTLVTNNAILNVTAAQKTRMDVVVTDITGKQVQKITYNLIAGSNQFTINFENLSAGTYQINGYTADGKSRTLRFVKQ